jgi:dTDP-4-amino-4,6-dideoxygalactose transaminase
MIRISRPLLDGEEKEELISVLGQDMLTNGPKVAEFQKRFADYCGAKHAVAVNNGTAALQVALQALGIGKGDEVITTAFSFVASANCAVYLNAKPVFVDIDPKTYNIDSTQIESKITKKTKAILPVHLYGLVSDMDPIMEIAEKHNLKVLEDACQAHGAGYKGKKAGSIGHAACFSFYPTKNMTTGEGGMITTNDPDVEARAKMIINQGQKIRYLNEILGINGRMTEFSAAVGLAQLKKLDGFNSKRRENAAFYNERLGKKYAVPFEPKGYRHVYHQYTIRAPNRDALAEKLKAEGIETGIYYPRTIPQQPIYGLKERFPEAEKAAAEVLSIPVHPGLSKEELEKIASALLK